MMILIIDTNIIFSALVKGGTTRELLINPPCNLYSPEHMIYEIRKYEDLIIEKSELTKEEFETLFGLITENIIIMEKEDYLEKLNEADEIIGSIHKGDVPFITLALSIPNNGVWSEDKHFEKQERIKIWKTKDIIEMIDKNI